MSPVTTAFIRAARGTPAGAGSRGTSAAAAAAGRRPRLVRLRASTPNAARTRPGESSPCAGSALVLDLDAQRRAAARQVRRRPPRPRTSRSTEPANSRIALGRKREAHPELEGRRLGKRLAHVLVDDARGHDADAVSRSSTRLSSVSSANAVERQHASGRGRACGPCAFAGQHDLLRRSPGVCVRPALASAAARLALPRLHEALGVGDAGRRADDHGRVEALGELERERGELARLAAVGRLEHGTCANAP